MKLRGRSPLVVVAVVFAMAVLATVSVANARTGPTARVAAPITLEVWDWNSPPSTATQPLVDKYMKAHRNIKIKMVHQPFNSVFTQLRTAIAVRKGPDVFRSYASPFIFDFQRGILPLTKLVTPADRKNLIGWQYVSGGAGGKGTPYALPWLAQSSMFYYNKALFKQAGLNPDKPPTTWAELLADCAALKKAGIVPIASGWKDGYYAEWWLDVTAAQYQTPAELANYAMSDWYAKKNPNDPKAGAYWDDETQQMKKGGHWTWQNPGGPVKIGDRYVPKGTDNWANNRKHFRREEVTLAMLAAVGTVN
jgi:ABC-type glycerol-3-phosphate transport system substrate-binding protein